jgi:hypothetical protein
LRQLLKTNSKTIKRRSFACLFVLFSFFAMPLALAETPRAEQEFYAILKSFNERVAQVSKQRSYKIKEMNDSVVAMAKAMTAMSSSQGASEAQKGLDASENAHAQNYFIHLLYAIMYDAQGQNDKATKSFESFLIRSRSYTEFERPLMEWRQFHVLRRLVYQILLQRGVNFEGREKQIQVHIPFQSFAEYLKHPEKDDEILNWFFVCVIIFGIPILIFSHFAQADFISFWLSSFVRLYFTTWLAYIGWMFDLLFGFPFELSRIKAVLLLYLLVFLIFGVSRIFKAMIFKMRPLEDGYRRCKKCSEVILKVVIECPKCRHVHQ